MDIDKKVRDHFEKVSTMEKIRLPRDGEFDLQFTGRLIATVSSRGTADTYLSEQHQKRWTVLELWETADARFVCYSQGLSSVRGERPRRKAYVAYSEDEVMDHFGAGWLAKMLYEQAGWDCVDDLDADEGA